MMLFVVATVHSCRGGLAVLGDAKSHMPVILRSKTQHTKCSDDLEASLGLIINVQLV